MATMKGKGAAVKGTSYQNKFEQPPVYTMPVTKRVEMPAKNAPRYAKGGSVSRGMGCTSKGGDYKIY
jgi:hypothetical protein